MASIDYVLQLLNITGYQDAIAFATLPGVETLKYSPFHGFCFFKEIFSFFLNLISDMISPWLVLLFHYKKINMLISFTQINSFSCFFWKILNNSIGFITPIIKKWSIRIKSLVATLALLMFHVPLDLPQDCSDQSCKEIMKVADRYSGITIFTI